MPHRQQAGSGGVGGPSATVRLEGTELPEIERALASTAWLPPMPALLAARYRASQLAARRPHNRRVILMMTIIFDLFLLAQTTSAPEVVRVSAVLRFGLVTPLAIAFALADSAGRLRRSYGPFLVTVAALPTAVSAVLTLMTNPHNMTAISDIHAIPLILLGTGVVARLTPAEVFSNVGVSMACFCASVLLARFIPAAQVSSLLLTDLAIGAAAIVFTLQLEARDRRVFLLRGADAINRTALAQRNQALLTQAQTDGLTGVANRRCFDETLAAAWTLARDQAKPLSLIILDIDHFKKYNDFYGHQAGDDCLRLVAETARLTVRATDLFTRYGGEEFAIILPNARLPIATAIAEKIRAAVQALGLPHEGAGAGQLVTVSLGVACVVPEPGGNPRRLVELADRHLYIAKRGGRNRVAAEPDTQAAAPARQRV